MGLGLPPDNYDIIRNAFEDAWLSELQRTPDMASERFLQPTTPLVAESNLQSIQDLIAPQLVGND